MEKPRDSSPGAEELVFIMIQNEMMCMGLSTWDLSPTWLLSQHFLKCGLGNQRQMTSA